MAQNNEYQYIEGTQLSSENTNIEEKQGTKQSRTI